MTTPATATSTAATSEITTTTTFVSDYDYNKEEKIKLVTAGLQDYYIILLKKQSNQNASTIIDYFLALNTEVNPTPGYKATQLKSIAYLSLFSKQKHFI